MDLHWAWMLEVLYGVLAIALGIAVLAVGGRRPVNGWLGALLLVEGLGWGGIASGLLTPIGDGPWLQPLTDLFALSTLAIPALSLLFTLWAVDTRWTRAMRRKRVGWAAVLLTVLAWAGYLATKEVHYDAWIDDASWVMVVVSAGSLLLTFFAYRAATPGTLEKKRLGNYLVAFAARDLGMIFTNVMLLYAYDRLEGPAYDGMRDLVLFAWAAYFFLFLGALAVGLLRGQILDFDLKVRATVSQGTMTALVVAIFVVATQVAQHWLNAEFGWVVGVVMAGVLVFLRDPMQKLTNRVANRLVPGARPTAEQPAGHRTDFYREQVALAWQDGTVGPKERAILRNLRERLGLSLEEAGRIELEVREATAG